MAMVDVHNLTDNSGIANARLALREVVDVFTRRAALTKVGAEEASSAVEIQKVEEEFTRALVRLKEQCSLVESSTTTIATIDEQTMLQDNDEQLILRDQLIEVNKLLLTTNDYITNCW
ncbi:hypothetical protein BDF19DRAFT_454473 [Syncephalis fuscata]|nr:hypothetical protein BDF19DRAFT_454473 [Syncephalis fuscata]